MSPQRTIVATDRWFVKVDGRVFRDPVTGETTFTADVAMRLERDLAQEDPDAVVELWRGWEVCDVD